MNSIVLTRDFLDEMRLKCEQFLRSRVVSTPDTTFRLPAMSWLNTSPFNTLPDSLPDSLRHELKIDVRMFTNIIRCGSAFHGSRKSQAMSSREDAILQKQNSTSYNFNFQFSEPPTIRIYFVFLVSVWAMYTVRIPVYIIPVSCEYRYIPGISMNCNFS